VNTLVLVTAFVVSVVESTCHARLNVAALSSVVIAAVNRALKTALHARTNAATTASIASARRNVVSLVIFVTRNASGVASIINARNYAGNCVIVHDVTNHVQSNLRAGILVSVSVGKYAQKNAESVTKTK